MSFYSGYYPPYVSAAERKRRNEKAAAKLGKKNPGCTPVIIEGNRIANTFWGKSWCKNIESYEDYAYRLGRGRSYVRQGAVIDLQIRLGKIIALVAGSSSEPYKIEIAISPLKAVRWEALKQKCTGKIDSLLALIQGKLSPEILALLCEHDTGLFPAPDEIKLDCSCPDYADCCKHVAAVLYGIGARLDKSPELFFLLRGIDQSELINAGAVDLLTDGTSPTLPAGSLTEIFGVEFDQLPEAPSPVSRPATAPAAPTAPPKKLPVPSKKQKTDTTAPALTPAPVIGNLTRLPGFRTLTTSDVLRVKFRAAEEKPTRPNARAVAEAAAQSPALILELFELMGMDKKSPNPFLRKIGITPATLKTWEAGTANPGPVSIKKITDFILLRAKKQKA